MSSDCDQESNIMTSIPSASQSLPKNNNMRQQKSSQIYKQQYKAFMFWAHHNKVTNYDEDVFMRYFSEKAKFNNPSTISSCYYMLKHTIMTKHNVDMSKFQRLVTFIRKQMQGYKPKESKLFTRDDVNRFLNEAPDRKCLMWKVSLIFGLSGACRMDELWKMTTNQVEDKGNILIVTIPNSNTKSRKSKVFRVSEDMCTGVSPLDLYRKYISLRPPSTSEGRLFLSYRDGACTAQQVGINSFGKIPSYIASYLHLPDSEMYKGHTFKKSSAALMTDTSLDLLTWKRLAMEQKCTAGVQRKNLQMQGNCGNVETAPIIDIDESSVDEAEKQISNSIRTEKSNSASTRDCYVEDVDVSDPLEDSTRTLEKRTSKCYLNPTKALQKRIGELEMELSALKEKLSELEKVKQENETLKSGNQRLRQENELLLEQLEKSGGKTLFGNVAEFVKSLQENEEKCIFCTGLRFKDISALYKFLSPFSHDPLNVFSKEKISGLEQLVLVLVRLRTGLSVKALKRSFNISCRYLRHIFLVWVQHCYSKFNVLRPLMISNRAKVQNKPADISHNLKNIKMIIDCAEFLSSESSYKVLLGCAPNGAVSFVSDIFEGSISDEELLRESNLCDLLETDDLVLADRGFVVPYEMERHYQRNICVQVPSLFEFTAEDEMEAEIMAKQRVHVDHLVQRVKQFKILETLPLNMRMLLSQIVFVCACLVNFQEVAVKP